MPHPVLTEIDGKWTEAEEEFIRGVAEAKRTAHGHSHMGNSKSYGRVRFIVDEEEMKPSDVVYSLSDGLQVLIDINVIKHNGKIPVALYRALAFKGKVPKKFRDRVTILRKKGSSEQEC